MFVSLALSRAKETLMISCHAGYGVVFATVLMISSPYPRASGKTVQLKLK